MLQSFMPDTTGRILGQLNAKERSMDDLKNFGLYPSGNKVTDKPEILFARLDVKEVLKKVEELQDVYKRQASNAGLSIGGVLPRNDSQPQ